MERRGEDARGRLLRRGWGREGGWVSVGCEGGRDDGRDEPVVDEGGGCGREWETGEGREGGAGTDIRLMADGRDEERTGREREETHRGRCICTCGEREVRGMRRTRRTTGTDWESATAAISAVRRRIESGIGVHGGDGECAAQGQGTEGAGRGAGEGDKDYEGTAGRRRITSCSDPPRDPRPGSRPPPTPSAF